MYTVGSRISKNEACHHIGNFRYTTYYFVNYCLLLCVPYVQFCLQRPSPKWPILRWVGRQPLRSLYCG